MADSKQAREASTRDKEERVYQAYTPPSVLPFPDPEPGVVFRYVATHVMGQADPSNVSKRYREGWVPCKSVDYPELMVNTNSDGNVEIGGLMLCKMSAEQARRRDEWYANDPRMPLFRDKQSSTTRGVGFGNGTK